MYLPTYLRTCAVSVQYVDGAEPLSPRFFRAKANVERQRKRKKQKQKIPPHRNDYWHDFYLDRLGSRPYSYIIIIIISYHA